jgi:hypothetical protein
VLASGSDLLFCAHHWHQNSDALRAVGVSIHDELDRLADTPATAKLDER